MSDRPPGMTREELIRALEAMVEVKNMIADAIKELDQDGRGTPSGPLYAAMMRIIDLHTYNTILDALVKEGKIKRMANVLYWKGGR